MELIEALHDPQAYPHPPREITSLETHISWILFAGDEVYKVKKPVDRGFLDFSTLKRRHHFCCEELRLNRRLAPSVYLDVVEIREAADGRIRVDAGAGRVVEYAVRMRRLPEHRMLENLLESGEVDNAQMNALADVLVAFHAAAETGGEVDAYGSRESIAATSRQNLARCEPFTREGGPRVVSPVLLAFLERWLESFLSEHAPVFDARVAGGRVREGHGDLHAGNICLEGPGTEGVAVFDCIEFDRRLRCVDVAADLAFLLMDLDLRGFRAFGGYLLKRYAGLAQDPDLDQLIVFYKLERSLVRGMVDALQAAEQRGARREAIAEKASRYFQLAATYGLGPVLIATCGLPGSGKSQIAGCLKPTFEALVVNSDITRKQLRGLEPGQPAGTAAYAPNVTAATYERMLELAREALGHGRPVILDAGFRSREQRHGVMRLAAEQSAAVCWVLPDADDATIRARLAHRAASQEQESDADIAVYDALRGSFEPPDEIPPSLVCHVPPDAPALRVVEAALDALVRSRSLGDGASEVGGRLRRGH